MASTSITFNQAVRSVIGAARRLGLQVPVFVSPPSVAGVDRTVRRRDTHTVVAIRTHGRPFGDIVSDVIEGVILVNRSSAKDIHHARVALLEAVEAELRRAA
jgi:hypothetical protein